RRSRTRKRRAKRCSQACPTTKSRPSRTATPRRCSTSRCPTCRSRSASAADPKRSEGMGLFDGKVAIVTGAARGLGRDYAEFFAADGASVVVADLDRDGAESAAKELSTNGASARAVAVDITDEASTLEMVADTIGALGAVDILVNNAALWGDLEHMAEGVLD